MSASTAPTTSSDPETLARKYMTSPQKFQRMGQFLSEGITNKASGGDGIPVELFQILKDDAVKVRH